MGLDQHRAQITYDLLDTETGEVRGGRICPADREGVRAFLARFAGGKLVAATEATTGWRFLVEELQAAGAEVHLAEPAETSECRGRKKRAKTGRMPAICVSFCWRATSARRRSSRPDRSPMRAHAPYQLINRGRLPEFSRRHALGRGGLERPSGRTATGGITPSPVMSPASATRSWTEIRLGACAHRPDRRRPPGHSRPRTPAVTPINPDAALAAVSLDR
jgi:hypothetical protein